MQKCNLYVPERSGTDRSGSTRSGSGRPASSGLSSFGELDRSWAGRGVTSGTGVRGVDDSVPGPVRLAWLSLFP